jgi:hypothetical protein
VELERLLCGGGRLLEGVSLAVQARQVGSVDVVAALLLRGKHELDLARLTHTRRIDLDCAGTKPVVWARPG